MTLNKKTYQEGAIISKGEGWCRKVSGGKIIRVFMCMKCKQHPCTCKRSTQQLTQKNLIQQPNIDTSLEDPCTCGLYPQGECLGKKPCPHE